MQNHPAWHYPHQPLPHPSRALGKGQAKEQATIGGLSLNGAILFMIGALVVGSGYSSLRPTVGGLALHPYLVPMAASFPFVVMARVHLFPLPILSSLLVFVAMYCFSVFNGDTVMWSEIVKVVSSVMTIIGCSLLIRRRGDFVAGALGLGVGVALLAAKGLQQAQTISGIEVMEGANKNTYSMYALPSLLLAGFIFIRMQTVPFVVRAMLMALALPAVTAIFLSANRSGYVCCVLVGLMLFWDRRGRGMFVVGGVAALTILLITKYGDTAAFDERMKQTVQGNTSDQYRVAIIKSCIEITLNNPVIGVSPQRLPFELGRITHVPGGHMASFLDSHNVFGHVAAASGLICFAALAGVGLTMCFPKMGDGKHPVPKNDPLRDARKLMRMMVVLWVFRGMFTREILYNPACSIGLGLAIGLYILAQSRFLNQYAEAPPPGRAGRALPAV